GRPLRRQGGPGEGARRARRTALDGRRGVHGRHGPALAVRAGDGGGARRRAGRAGLACLPVARRGHRLGGRHSGVLSRSRWRSDAAPSQLRADGPCRGRQTGRMRTAYSVKTVRAAERELMARLPEGTLMRRASAGLAAACSGMLGRTYGSRVVLLVGSGDNGGDALYVGAYLARRGAGVTAVL